MARSITFATIISFMLLSFNMYGQHITADTAISHDSVVTEKAHNPEGGFKPGDFMLEHILDSHEWHIITVGHTHVSIPLPVILYSKVSGLHFFMSSKFHHGTESYKNFYIAEEGPNKGKIVEKVQSEHGEKEIVPLDLSITKVVFSLLLSCILLLVVFISIARKYTREGIKAPSGLQSALEPMILFVVDDIAKPSLGEKKYEKFLPYLLTIFFFIWFNNMLGLIPIFPGGANVTGNIAVTMVLAAFTFVITTINGNKHYWEEIYNAPGVPWWLKFPIPLMPFIEILGLIIKPVVLMVRLFANITAGHLIILAFVSLIFIFAQISPALGYGVSVLSTAFALFMSLLELLVALIQAYVFTLLSAIYFSMATAEHH
ncbi:MAG TPA: F0F1 ATP synthase subunit A [Bacteroidales bacterium]|nr:F0F1 ATP synthase subunit A [Bacteroidales bacterium]